MCTGSKESCRPREQQSNQKMERPSVADVYHFHDEVGIMRMLLFHNPANNSPLILVLSESTLLMINL